MTDEMDLMLVEELLCVASAPVGVPVYDFDFGLHFRCKHPYIFDENVVCVLRIGAIHDYLEVAEKIGERGLRLVNSVEEHARASELEVWYPLLKDLTPRTQVFDVLPESGIIERDFTWPVFIKGSRQTSRHNPDLSVVRDREHYERVRLLYAGDPILNWQKPVVWQFIELEPVEGSVPGKIRPSLEFRSFWWFGRCVGVGRYWYQVPDYAAADFAKGLAVAEDAALRLQVPFLVVDFAKTTCGRWIVIECNDAQESGLAAIRPQVMWADILRLVAARSEGDGPTFH